MMESRRSRRNFTPAERRPTLPLSEESPPTKAIYIYPGLLRLARHKAVNIDSQCPATIYKCTLCSQEADYDPNDDQCCSHDAGCSICLEEFHSHDLVRKMPCSSNHMFHSGCILTWLGSNNRCPLCNESIQDKKKKSKAPKTSIRNDSIQADGRPSPGERAELPNTGAQSLFQQECPGGMPNDQSGPSEQLRWESEEQEAQGINTTPPSVIDEQVQKQTTADTRDMLKLHGSKRNYSYIDYDQGRWSSKRQ